MRIISNSAKIVCLALIGYFSLTGCVSTAGGGGGGGNGGGNGTGQPLPTPCVEPGDGGEATPAAELVFPVAGASVGAGMVDFLFSATDQDGDELEVTVFVSDNPDVFNGAATSAVVCGQAQPDTDTAALQVPSAGTFYWGIEVTDGTNTIRRPADGVGIEFVASAISSGRQGLQDVTLLCPRDGQPARAVTRFEWIYGDITPIRAQVFVGRANQDNPFNGSLRVFDVSPPTATSLAIALTDALPLNQELSWGLRVETADQVLFTFEGQLGVSFTAEDNVPPSGTLLGPSDDAVLADTTETFQLSWEADAGNCEDQLTSTVFFAKLVGGNGPAALFESPISLPVGADSLELNLAAALDQLDISGGRWAWGIMADDGTDLTGLSHSDDPAQTFRTIIRNTAPEFVDGPLLDQDRCGGQFDVDALSFSFADENGLDSVGVRLSYAETRASVFDDPLATMDVPITDLGSILIALSQDGGGTACAVFDRGAGFYGVELDDDVNPPVRESRFYGGPPPGACCLPDGGCLEVVRSECIDGIYQGDDTICGEVDCPLPKGACCLGDGSCTEGTIDECLGNYQGDDTSCGQVSCPQPPPVIIDCNNNGTPDDQELIENDCNNNGVPDDCESNTDCNSNGLRDFCDIAFGLSQDCDLNGIPDECEDVFSVDAGVLAIGLIDDNGGYQSSNNGNDLTGSVCPPTLGPVLWTLDSGPPDGVVELFNPTSLISAYEIVSPAIPGDYVFRLTAGNFSDTVTLSLFFPPIP